VRRAAWTPSLLCVLAFLMGCSEASAPRPAASHPPVVTDRASAIRGVSQLPPFGGPGSQPGQFRAPSGIVVGPRGEIYVADTGNHRVQVLDSAGGPAATLGSFGWDVGEFDAPHALALSPVRRSTLYIADRGAGRVQGCDAVNMVYRHVAEDTADSRLDPTALAVGSRNEVYIADAAGHRVWRVSVDGEVEWMRGQFGDALGQLNTPSGFALDDSGGMLVADAGNRRLVRMDFAGNPLAAWRPDGLATPGAVAWGAGRWFVCDVEAGGVVVLDASGVTEIVIGRGDVAAPGGVAVAEETVYVTDRAGHDIKRYLIAYGE
jgi:DNA-binding beta-propeller fold protein YncE